MIEIKEVTNSEVKYAVDAAVNEFRYKILKFLMEHSEKSYIYESSFIINKDAMLDVLDGKEPVVEVSKAGGDEDRRELDKDKPENP